jgi:hypothetical protein
MYYILSTNANMVAGRWYHLTTTFDGATGEGKHYRDGTLIHTGTIGPSPIANTGPIFIGTDPFDDHWDGLLDDIRIYDTVLGPSEIAELAAIGGGGGSGGGGGGGSGSCDGNFRDNFDARSFSGSDGTLTWATDWLEVGESDGPTGGDVQVTNDTSNYQLRTQDNDNGGEGVQREADLSGATSATLNYEYRRNGLDRTSDYTAVEVSANGAAGPWVELARHDGSGNDTSYQSASHPITDYISTNTRIRFKTSSGMGRTDMVWFDNIEITCTP